VANPVVELGLSLDVLNHKGCQHLELGPDDILHFVEALIIDQLILFQ